MVPVGEEVGLLVPLPRLQRTASVKPSRAGGPRPCCIISCPFQLEVPTPTPRAGAARMVGPSVPFFYFANDYMRRTESGSPINGLLPDRFDFQHGWPPTRIGTTVGLHFAISQSTCRLSIGQEVDRTGGRWLERFWCGNLGIPAARGQVAKRLRPIERSQHSTASVILWAGSRPNWSTTERVSNSINLDGKTGYVAGKREYCYEEGSFWGAFTVCEMSQPSG